MQELNSINTFLFADETKFSINDNDTEDSIFYFAVSISKAEEKIILHQYKKIEDNFKLIKGFHANKIFKKKNPNTDLVI